ncbi:MAG TPA: sugar transferase [Opitutaceae bacterium]|nr:sugar transferase [Opitutaceae bacterium]
MMNQTMTAKADVFSCEEKARERHPSTPVLLVGLVGDTLIVFLALAFSSWLRFATPLARLGVGADSIHWTEYMGKVIFGVLLFILLLPHRQLYDLHLILNLRRTIPVIIRTAFSWFLTFMALSWLLRYGREISRIYVAIAFVVTTAMFVLWRLLLCRIVSSESIVQRLRQRILFVGWSEPAESIAGAINADSRHLYEIVGHVPAGRRAGGERPGDAIPKLGARAGMADILREHGIDMVILADLNPSTDETVALANLCEKEMVEFKVIPSNCFEIFLSCLHLQTVSGVPVLGVAYFPLDLPFNVLLKRALDLAGGVVGLLLSAPLIAAFGLFVYWESPGPIIYRQRRLGHYGRPFWIYKIRSMKMDAEHGGKVGWTVKNDPRRLRIGGFMRRWNIDELPQFWNVIKGEMSLVGPRPERPELIKVFKEEIPHYNARHNIKPGITGWAQVNGFRGDTDLNGRISCDLYYIENWSLLLDFQIMFMTIFRHRNAC